MKWLSKRPTMTPAEAISALPDDTPVSVTIGGASSITIGELRAALTSSGPIYITVRQASNRYSRSEGWWRDRAPEIEGAVKDQIWRLPVKGCEELLARLAAKPRRRMRGPWKARLAEPELLQGLRKR